MDRSSFSGESANLDLIRTVAVLSVFFAHLRESFLPTHSDWMWRFGQMGVLIFFAHTSFVLMLSLERSKYHGKTLFSTFYLRRFFRLYPLSIFCVLIAYVLHASPERFVHYRLWTIPQLLSNLALTTNLTYTDVMVGGLWTLPLEVQMYIALPFLFILCGKRHWGWLFALWLLSVPIAYIEPHVSGRLNVFAYVPSFLGGVIAWRLSRQFPRRLPGWVWPVAFTAVAFLWLSTNRENYVFHRWAFGLGLGLSIPFFREITLRPLARAAHEIAKYSYGLYLSHVAMIFFIFGLHQPLVVRWVIFSVCAVCIPVAIYHFLEKPMIDFGQRLTTRIFRPRETTPAAQAVA